MVSLNNVSFGYGAHDILKDTSFNFKPGTKVGLIGPNGAGKSTIFRIISGDYTPTSGELSKGKGTKIEFFNQDLLSTEREEPIIDVVIEGFKEVVKIKHEIEDLNEKLAHDYSDDLIEKMGELQSRFEHFNGYALEAKAEEVLAGLGFETKDFQRPLSEFSGGWRMRVLLGKMLIAKPDLLLLDEPSNHLDLPSIEWLENYLQTYPQTFVLISHDRKFLNNTVTEILELYNKGLVSYKGNYNDYLVQKQERQEIEENAFRNQQKKIKDTEKFITRFRAKATKARQVQSRIKSLEKMDRLEIDQSEQKVMRLDFPIARRTGKVLFESEGFSQAYPGLELFHEASFQIERGDKIALIGANGKGKSTILKIIKGLLPITGNIEEGHNVDIEYYAQHQLEQLDAENTVIKEAMDGVRDKTEKQIRDILGSFLFTGEETEKKIKVLSGGEKARVALAKVFLKQPNFLLLDEPTNHLDLVSIQVLQEALNGYQGSYVLVSHNRDLIANVANKIWTIEGKDIKEHPGDYDSYVYRKSQEAGIESKEKRPEEKKKAKSKTEEVEKPKKVGEHKIKEIEKRIESMEIEIKEAENLFLDPEIYSDTNRSVKLKNEIEQKKVELGKLFEEWEELHNE